MTPDELARAPSVSDGLLQQMIDREMNAGNSDNESAFRELQARRAADRNVLRHWSDGYRSGYGFSKAISELLP